MAYLGTQPNDVKKNTGLYTPSEILQLTKDGSWGGSLELIAQESYSSAVSEIDFTSIQESKYDVHLFQLSNVHSATNGTNFRIRFFESGVLETASVYQWARQVGTVGGSFLEQKNTGQNYIPSLGTLNSTSGASGQQYIYCYNFGDTNKYSFLTFQDFTFDTNNGVMTFGGGVLPQTSTVNGVRFFLSSGNFSSFDIKLYGVKQI